jgi:alanine racemase
MLSFQQFLKESFNLIPKYQFRTIADGQTVHSKKISGHLVTIKFNPTTVKSKETHIVGFEIDGGMSRGGVKNPKVANEIKNHIRNVVMSHIHHTGINNIWYRPEDSDKEQQSRKAAVYKRALRGPNVNIAPEGAGMMVTFKKQQKPHTTIAGRIKKLIGM